MATLGLCFGMLDSRPLRKGWGDWKFILILLVSILSFSEVLMGNLFFSNLAALGKCKLGWQIWQGGNQKRPHFL